MANKRSRCIVFTALWLTIGALSAQGNLVADVPSKQANVLNVVTSLSSSDPMFAGLQRFKTLVEARSGGRLAINIFVGSQLGNDDDILEQAMAGAAIAVLVDGGRLSVYSHELGILGAPYLVNNINELRALVGSPLFEQWNRKLQDSANLRVLAFNWWQGARHLLTQQPVTQPRDLSGVRLRTISAPVWISTIDAMGATPTPLSWSEVYSALQQRVIDGGEAQLAAVWGARLYEVISHVTKTGHIQLISGLVTSDDWFTALTPTEQDMIIQAAIEAGDHASQKVLAAERNIEQSLADAGVSITTPDIQLFIDATEPVYERLGYTRLREEVRDFLSKQGTPQ
ncbi:C4-dicarboxylate TRAP transporter substrate-binding protein [Alteromonas gilva]|uniref:C4-dicarboxylate TRAP transporter substrate-binding protein n=1 Tax=Alteromonas gilva TaxID=2987522 RepID=A0ABT5L5H1_9ALTE|nr:C4-dicarboxylate TRAP transporter substrate-binding protein [Alteromonas gilva]MDC8832309.1 C4-dicarboxylate TRAP transporter substrate-binding protein [Alteromonas gilva]